MSQDFDPNKTQPFSPAGGDLQRTQFMGPTPSPSSGGGDFDPKKTQVMGGMNPQGGGFDPLRTQVYQGHGVSPAARQAPQNRKLVGWLVSFTLHPNGVDFRLYEGRNLIGSGPNMDIVLNDPGVSAHHLTILYRAGQFLFRDELSTNGTFLNGQMVNEGELKDGDTLRIGETELRFRTV